ncbi:hypothetical protein K6T43_12455 (plasmid) [Riemerella anatipestifer]|nr:hypothetical protein K6T43_12455 [Riemerella anatipestifer]
MLKYKKCKKYFKKITLEKFNGINGAEKRHFDRKISFEGGEENEKTKKKFKREPKGVLCVA